MVVSVCFSPHQSQLGLQGNKNGKKKKKDFLNTTNKHLQYDISMSYFHEEKKNTGLVMSKNFVFVFPVN